MSKSAIINNSREPNFEALAKLEAFFNVSANFLLGKSTYRSISEERFFNEVLHLDETLKDKPEEIRNATISIYNSFKETVDKIAEHEEPYERNLDGTMKRLSILRLIN